MYIWQQLYAASIFLQISTKLFKDSFEKEIFTSLKLLE